MSSESQWPSPGWGLNLCFVAARLTRGFTFLAVSGRYKALLLDGSGNGYLRTVCDYVHLNPVRAGLLKSEAPLESFAWGSYGYYLQAPEQRPSWLRVDRLFGEKGIPKDSEAGRQQFALDMERRRAEESAADYEEIRRAWYLGAEEFRRELLAAAGNGLASTTMERSVTRQASRRRSGLSRKKPSAWGGRKMSCEGDLKGTPQKSHWPVASVRKPR